MSVSRVMGPVYVPDHVDSNPINASVQLPRALPPPIQNGAYVLCGNLYIQNAEGDYEELEPPYFEIMEEYPNLYAGETRGFVFEFDARMHQKDVFVGILLTNVDGEENGRIIAECYVPAEQFMSDETFFSLQAIP